MAKKKAEDIKNEARGEPVNPPAEAERKSFTGVELKADKPGHFTAIISTLNVVDKQGDVTLAGAAPNGKTVLISAYQHGSWANGKDALPIGKGVIREEGDKIFIDGEFNLKSETGREHYETVKFAPELQEWSYGLKVTAVDEESSWNDNPKVYRVIKSMEIYEASPVLLGAGVNTACTSIKSEGTKTFNEETETVLAAAADWLARTKSLADLRKEEGRKLSQPNRERISELLKSIDELSAEVKSLLAPPAPPMDPKLFLEASKLKSEFLEVVSHV